MNRLGPNDREPGDSPGSRMWHAAHGYDCTAPCRHRPELVDDAEDGEGS